MEKQFIVKVGTGTSKKTGNKYVQAYIDLGYRKINVSFDKATIAELFDISVSEIYKMLEK